jgi:hypothetical protein
MKGVRYSTVPYRTLIFIVERAQPFRVVLVVGLQVRPHDEQQEEHRSNIVRALPRKGLKEHQQKEGLLCKKNS